MIRDIGEAVGDRLLETAGRAVARAQAHRDLPVDLLESDDAYLAVFDAPGATGKDVQARYEDGAVLVRVDRFRDRREGFEMRFPGRGLTLDGRVELPLGAMVDSDGATATLQDNGTLHVRVPKTEYGSSQAGSSDDHATVDDTGADASTGAAHTESNGDDPTGDA